MVKVARCGVRMQLSQNVIVSAEQSHDGIRSCKSKMPAGDSTWCIIFAVHAAADQ